MKKIRFLLVGFGPRGKIWEKAIKKNSKAKLVGICDINKNKKDGNLKNIIFFDKLEKALSYCKPDAVILSTPPFKRMNDIKLCAKFKLPILKYITVLLARLSGIVNPFKLTSFKYCIGYLLKTKSPLSSPIINFFELLVIKWY